MGIQINPPPADRRCMRCNRHKDELTPFGGPGDPLVGDFSGQLLVKNFRTMDDIPNINNETLSIFNEYDKILDEYQHLDGGGDNITELENKYGVQKVGEAFNYDQFKNTVSPSWECRDCFIL